MYTERQEDILREAKFFANKQNITLQEALLTLILETQRPKEYELPISENELKLFKEGE